MICYLSYNARSFIADQTYAMFDLKMDRLVTKETTNARKGRDNTDEDRLLTILQTFKFFSENSITLINIATKDVATCEIQESLLKANENGEEHMLEFVKRITEGEEIINADEIYKNIERKIQKHLRIFT